MAAGTAAHRGKGGDMRKLALALLLVTLLAGAAYGSGNRKTIREYYPRDQVVVEREVVRERPVYVEEERSHHKWWQWNKKERHEEREEHEHRR
jgi:hypothetical protein